MSGVTTIRRRTPSMLPGRRTLPWLNIEVAFSSARDRGTAGRKAKAAITTNDAHRQGDRRVERSPVVTSNLKVGVVHAMQRHIGTA